MRQHILAFLLNKYVSAAIITLLILICLPDYFNKYKIELTKSEWIQEGNIVYFSDLDGDGYSEKIIAQTNTIGNASFRIYNSNGDFFDQFNYDTQFPNRHKYLWFQDVDNNRSKEIYLMSQSKDSAFLNILEPYKAKGINKNKIFIDTISKFNDSYEFSVNRSSLLRKHEISDSLIVFNIMTGFAANPRHAYKYDIKKDTLYKSSHLVNSSAIYLSLNLDDDPSEEFLVSNTTAGNYIDSIYTHRSDYITWLTLLDDDMQFLIEPISFNAQGSLMHLPFNINDETVIISLFNSKEYSKLPSKLMTINPEGKILKEKELNRGWYDFLYQINEDELVVYNRRNGALLKYNTDLDFKESYSLKANTYVSFRDIDNEGIKEGIEIHTGLNNVTIYDSNLKHPTSFKYFKGEGTNSKGLICSIKQNGSESPELVFQKGNTINYLTYSNNPWYYAKYAVYVGIYLFVLGGVWLIIKGQKLREAKRRAIETQIAELQIKTIKNQVDPHFVFNAINTISEMTLMNNKLEADKFIGQFSKFMRSTLMQSDKITTTLKEELGYTENFIKLQQIRFSNSFDYIINIEKGIDKSFKIPKHTIFTYVENAIKHGLANMKQGRLAISVTSLGKCVSITIDDNGVGLNKANTPKHFSTGSGLKINERIFKLYSRLHKKEISYKVTDLSNTTGKTGTRITINIV